MSLAETLKDFAGAIGRAASVAPDEYPEWSSDNYGITKADIEELWPMIRAKLKRDADKIAFIDEKLTEAFTAFDAGEKERGRKAMWAIYNLGLKDLR